MVISLHSSPPPHSLPLLHTSRQLDQRTNQWMSLCQQAKLTKKIAVLVYSIFIPYIIHITHSRRKQFKYLFFWEYKCMSVAVITLFCLRWKLLIPLDCLHLKVRCTREHSQILGRKKLIVTQGYKFVCPLRSTNTWILGKVYIGPGCRLFYC